MKPLARATSEIIEEGSTPDLILKAAGRLFAAKGFHGTSTRQIAEAVGIRQPSLFHHFESKTEIAGHLLEYDRQRSPFLSDRLELPDQSPPVRLYHSLRREALVVQSSRYELQGLYLNEVLEEPEFLFWRQGYRRAMANVHALVVAGTLQGDFVEIDATIVTQLFDAMLTRMVRWGWGREYHADPDEIGGLLLRAILRDPFKITEIRAMADLACGDTWPGPPLP